MKWMDNQFRMNSCLLAALFILLSFGIDIVQCAECQGVIECVNTFVSKTQSIGHDRSAYCSAVSEVIACIKKVDCLGDTAIHKTDSLRTFQTDRSCSGGMTLAPKSSLIFLSTLAYITWMFCFKNIL
ncbi:uncharacterized protein LOC106061942 [Biomphalaria glabrata]|uniref:Uncharacterized protein LOC106061942 n=1 Tax=Biomphalaria glabrata TaxID=6526 RepID=A0A9W3AHF2_BIOGL|nr:uncharacterized protein LOC106061942 [Biomphalaria glabrata]XP_055886620.1 uncharacterized protein LOC106061942 [Biomphalaria glabrata]XP_055886621.1 uncharacterized protein LOC106061942 [Biomphalaria glabrata]XP_055886622.1 uncharacterized protein LOC106061942 [Biomphalaria glabrata]XP_055886623.1 uncharacterized protein LOC106061942 [Biomphalaria glabrata]XP_055886624.1 uncharacterized protein LOC106061942 [Biomphalaria glabrata]XP_055886626.1 uncharacterized protein LOC106061942 [Biomph